MGNQETFHEKTDRDAWVNRLAGQVWADTALQLFAKVQGLPEGVTMQPEHCQELYDSYNREVELVYRQYSEMAEHAGVSLESLKIHPLMTPK